MDSRLDQNKSVLGILVLSALLKMLSDVDGLSNHTMNILWDLWSTSVLLKESGDLLTGQEFGTWDCFLVSDDDTNL